MRSIILWGGRVHTWTYKCHHIRAHQDFKAQTVMLSHAEDVIRNFSLVRASVTIPLPFSYRDV